MDAGAAAPPQGISANLLLAGLPPEEERRLGGLLVRTLLPVGHVLQSAGAPVEHVWFPDRGAVSLSVDSGRRLVELALIGREGAIGTAALLLPEAPALHHAVVQIAGPVFGVRADLLRSVLADCPELRARCLRFAHGVIGQISRTAACNVSHTLPQRLALRLLLRCDRVPSGELSLTQESLAAALGVRRAGVAVAISVLQRSGVIEQRRRRVVVRDRGALEQASCDCYAAIAGLRDGTPVRPHAGTLAASPGGEERVPLA